MKIVLCCFMKMFPVGNSMSTVLRRRVDIELQHNCIHGNVGAAQGSLDVKILWFRVIKAKASLSLALAVNGSFHQQPCPSVSHARNQ